MPTPEEDVLKPVDPSITDSDQWAIFTLSNAQVVYESNGEPASLLAAYTDTPVRVTGRLETPGRGLSKYLLKKSYKPIDIEVRNVMRFSYGEMTDGDFAIWAQGKAGWFEIRPAPHYHEIYQDMVEAVELLYFVTDIYSESRKKSGGPSPQLIFQEYAEDERFSCNSPEAAKAIFHKHHIFLVMCFLIRAQGIIWSNTSIYQYFRRLYTKDLETCKARIEGRHAEMQPKGRSQTVHGKVTVAKSEGVPPKKDDNWWEAAALFELMQKAVNQGVVRAGRNQVTLDRVAQLIVKRYEIEELETAHNVLLVHGKNLCYIMDHPRRKSVRFFADEPIYRELVTGRNLSAVEQRRTESIELKPRRNHANLKDDAKDSSDTTDEEDDQDDVLTTPVRRPPSRRKRGRLSVLRPRSAKYSGKKGKSIERGQGKGGKGKAPLPNSATSENESDAEATEQATDSRDEMGIDTPTQMLSPGREKRRLDESDVDEEEDNLRRKRTGSVSATPDTPLSTVDSEDDAVEVASTNGTMPPLPLQYNPTNTLTSTVIGPSLVSTPLPIYEANGPRNSWICNFDGCSQRIYGCHKILGRQLITEHLEDHAKGREKVVGILWREQDKLQLPVSNLIKKIREMSEASTPLFPAETTERFEPTPIQRHT
ncbi:hypothetical protein GQ44DRAFT_706604 [Phaeosphaeriaceae sp. PMI808]|nr:hypothetical protein GQ44DRAFT_706604 [Phaeosphaeriaceae sp. PMI808]